MSTPAVNSLRWWQCLAVLVGLVVVVCSAAPLASSTDQNDDGAPVVVVAGIRVNCRSTNHSSHRTFTPGTPVAVDGPLSRLDRSYPKGLDTRSVLHSSCSLRC